MALSILNDDSLSGLNDLVTLAFLRLGERHAGNRGDISVGLVMMRTNLSSELFLTLPELCIPLQKSPGFTLEFDRLVLKSLLLGLHAGASTCQLGRLLAHLCTNLLRVRAGVGSDPACFASRDDHEHKRDEARSE